MKQSFENVKTVLVRCPNWVGDIVMATPAFACLRRSLPDARMVAALAHGKQLILHDSPWFDDYLDYDDKSWKGLWETIAGIRRYGPDMAVLFPNSPRAALVAWLGGTKRIYGYRGGARSLLLAGGPGPPRRNGQSTRVPMPEYYLEICRWLGFEPARPPRPMLFIGEDLARRGQALCDKYGLGPGDLVIGLNPGASYGSSKCWPAEHFARLGELVFDRLGAKIMLFYGPGEEQIAQVILQQTRAPIIDTGPDRIDLALLKPLIQRCNLLITNDTGPRHYAVAFDVPVVVLMGPTDPAHTASSFDKAIVIRKELDCSPCYKKICPRQHECMKNISPEEVLAAAEELLNRYSERRTGTISK